MLEQIQDRWFIRWLVIIAVLAFFSFGASITVIYVVDQYVSPAWDEESVPPARNY